MRVRDVVGDHGTGVISVVVVAGCTAVVVGGKREVVRDQDHLHPHVRDGIEAPRRVQRVVEAGPVLCAVDQVEAHHGASRCAPPAASSLASEVDVDVGVRQVVDDVSTRIRNVRVHVLVDAARALLLRHPERDTESSIARVVEAIARNRNVVAGTVEVRAVRIHRSATVYRSLLIIARPVASVADEPEIDIQLSA